MEQRNVTISALEKGKQELTTAVNELTITVAGLEEEATRQNLEWEKDTLAMKNKIEMLEDENRKLNNESERLRLKLDDVERLFSEIEEQNEATIKDLNVKIEEYETKIKGYLEVETANRDMLKELSRLRSQLEANSVKESKLNQENGTLTLKITELEYLNRRLTDDLVTMAKKCSDSEEERKMELEQLKERHEMEREKHIGEKDKATVEVRRLQKIVNELESTIRRLKDSAESVNEEKKRDEDRFNFELHGLLEKYESERKRNETLKEELQQKTRIFEEKNREWTRKLEDASYRHRDEREKLLKEKKTLEESYEKQLKDLKEEATNEREICERKISQLEQTYKHEINTVRYEREQYFREVSSKEIEKTRKELEKEKNDLQQEFLAEKKQLIEDYNKRIQDENRRFTQCEEKYKTELETLTRAKSEMERKIYDLETTIERTKEQLTYRFTEERRKIEYKLESELREVKEKHRLELIERSQKDKLDMEAKVKTEREEFEEKISLEYQAKITKEVSNRERQLKDSFQKLENEFRAEKERLLETEGKLKMQNELLLREKDAWLKQSQRDKDELSGKLEHEKELLNVTLEAMSRELSKMREEKTSLSESFKKEKRELEKKYETEMAEWRNKVEKGKQELMARLREEYRQAAQANQRSADATITGLKEKLVKAERKIVEAEENFKKEKSKLEHQFKHEKMEIEQRTQRITQELKVFLEQEFYKRSQDERKIYENTLSNLRSEILELQEGKSRLERTLLEQQMIAHSLGRDVSSLKSETQQSSPRQRELSLLERELQELRHKNEKLKIATKEAQFYNNELVQWESGKNCPVLKTAQEMTPTASTSQFPVVYSGERGVSTRKIVAMSFIKSNKALKERLLGNLHQKVPNCALFNTVRGGET